MAKVNFTVSFSQNDNIPGGTPVPATKVRGALVKPDGTEEASAVKPMDGSNPVSFEFTNVPDVVYTARAQGYTDDMTQVGSPVEQSGIRGVVSAVVPSGIAAG